nr:hypothetical protein [Aquihabitans sp. G128]
MAVGRGAEQGVGARLHAVELHQALEVAARDPLGLDGQPGGAGLHHEQAHLAVAERGGDEDGVGHGGGRDARLGAGEAPAVALGRGGGGGGLRDAVARFQEGGGEDGRAVHRAGQPAGLLLGGAEAGDRERAAHDRGQHRHRGQRAAHLLQHDALLEDAEALAAVVGGQGHAEEAGVGQGGPDAPVEALLALLDLPEEVLGDLVGEDAPGQAGDLVLFVAACEVHCRRLLRRPATGAPGACPGRPWR